MTASILFLFFFFAVFYNCREYGTVQVDVAGDDVRTPLRPLVFDTASTLYVAQAGPLIANSEFTVSVDYACPTLESLR